MYKVLYQPELRQRLPSAPQGAFICLVFEGSNHRLRDKLYSVATDEKLRQEHSGKFELAALMLNQPPSFSIQRLRLRSVAAVWQRAEEEARRRSELSRRSTSFRADFGRMDIGLNPGWGRD